MAKEAFMLAEKKRVMGTILSWIQKAGMIDKALSLKKLKAMSAIQLGLSEKKFNEYIQNFIDIGNIKVDGDDVWADPESHEIFKNLEEK